MAQIKLNILVSDVRSRLGNVVFSKWKKTNYVREYLTYSRGNTQKQTNVRNAFSAISLVWKAMGNLMQKSWNHYASGENMTGRNAFIGANVKKVLNNEALELCKPMGEIPLASLTAEAATSAGGITCTFTLPNEASEKYLFFFSQKKDATGKGSGDVRRFDAGLNAQSPFSITGLEAGADYFIYAVLADNEYANAETVSASIAASARAGA